MESNISLMRLLVLETKNFIVPLPFEGDDDGIISKPILGGGGGVAGVSPSAAALMGAVAHALRNLPSVSGVGFEIERHAGRRDGSLMDGSSEEDRLIGSNMCLSATKDVPVIVRFSYATSALS